MSTESNRAEMSVILLAICMAAIVVGVVELRTYHVSVSCSLPADAKERLDRGEPVEYICVSNKHWYER